MDVAAWLQDLGLERYAQAFLDNDVAAAVLPELTDEDLKGLGVSLGHRRLLLKAIRELQANARHAKSWELRAARDLARLWADQGRRAEAHDLLAPVYDGFTEGFETTDLEDAKALLDELR